MSLRLGEALIERGLLDAVQLKAALAEQERTHEFLGAILIRRGAIGDEDLARALSEQYDMPYWDLKQRPVNWAVAQSFGPSVVVDLHCLPLRRDESGLWVAITNPLDVETISRIEQAARGEKVCLALVKHSDLDEAIRSYSQKRVSQIRDLLEPGS